MKKEIYVKNYGIVKIHNGRYAIVTNVNDAHTEGQTSLYMNYARPKFALKKADEFAKSLYKNFIRKIGEEEISIEFILNNIGIITLLERK